MLFRQLSLLMSAVPSPPPPGIASILSEKALDFAFVRTPSELPTNSAAEAAVALGLESPSRVVKSLVFIALNGVPLLVLATGEGRIHIPSLEQQMGCRVRMATASEALIQKSKIHAPDHNPSKNELKSCSSIHESMRCQRTSCQRVTSIA